MFHQRAGNRPPTFFSTILEDSGLHAGRQKSAESFPHVSIVVLDALNSNIAHTTLSISECLGTLLMKKKSKGQSLVYQLRLELMCFLKTTKCAAYTWHSHSFGLKKASFIFLYKKVYLVCVCVHTHACDRAST